MSTMFQLVRFGRIAVVLGLACAVGGGVHAQDGEPADGGSVPVQDGEAKSPARAQRPTAAERLALKATAGPGYIQQSFVGGLEASFGEQFGPVPAGRMIELLRKRGLDADDALGLMNGRRMMKSDLRKTFGLRGAQLDDAEKAIGRAVDAKDRALYFGVLLTAMVADFDVDPAGEFCKQIVAARGMSADDFRQLRAGVMSRSLCEDAFGLDDEDDQRFMQDVLKRVNRSPLLKHPMAGSLGLGRGGFDRDAFPVLRPGMPGSGDAFADGSAGGLPFDKDLPPCPFAGENLEGFFEGERKAAAEAAGK